MGEVEGLRGFLRHRIELPRSRHVKEVVYVSKAHQTTTLGLMR